ncbi:MAG: hypothetical protein EPO11_07750 [Gammaproteobacteria bacterium]|nr:MAG: hypothetical protein EPO11_07750 [Gammaproteobacteria bacterium]
MAIDPNKEELANPGKRLKYIRSLLRVSRAYLQEKYGLPEVTLKSWENETTSLTHSGAKRCVDAYRGEGLIVSEDWIMEGVGLDPKTTVTVSHYFANPTSKELSLEDDEVAMVREANAFKESYPNAVIMIVSNDDMRPFYRPGDYVGGKMRFGEAIKVFINKDCIIYLKNGERFFRRFIKNSVGGYNLTCLNPNENTVEPVLYNVDVDGVAPVIWHRWKDE